MSGNDSVRFTPQEKPVLILILLTYFMILLDSSIVFTSVPVMKADLGLSAAEMSWVQDAYTLTFGGALLLGAQLGEVWGRTRVFLGGLIVFAVASLKPHPPKADAWPHTSSSAYKPVPSPKPLARAEPYASGRAHSTPTPIPTEQATAPQKPSTESSN